METKESKEINELNLERYSPNNTTPFILFRGVVEDNNDPLQIGRVRVRIYGLHTSNNENSSEKFEFVRTVDLPWAEVMGSFGLVGGVGLSHVLRQGTWVWVILENNDPNKPIVMGTITGVNSTSSSGKAASGEGFFDPSGVYPHDSRKTEPLKDNGTSPGEIKSRSNRSDMHPKMDTNYRTNIILETESGHLIELEDTPGGERIKISHKTGSFLYIDKDGNFWFRGVKDLNFDIENNVNWNIGKNLNIKTGGTQLTESVGDYTVTAPNIFLN
jgi:hypothetical protein